MNKVGKNIKILRKKMKLSQCHFAQKIGLKRSNIASYENGTCEPRIDTLLKISDVFNVNVSNLVCNDLSLNQSVNASSLNIDIDTSLNRGSNNIDDNNATYKGFAKQAQQFQEVISSFNCVHCYKMDQLKLDELPKDVRILAINFEELLSLSTKLMDAHKDLLKVYGQKSVTL